jgi:glycine cleavage system H protein
MAAVPSALRIRLGSVPEISAVATAPSARFALPSDRHYFAGSHVWAQIENGIATIGVTAPLGEVLWYTPEIEYWAVDRVEVGETLATVQGKSSRTVAVGSPVRGTLVELNPLLKRAPHALLAQPYGRGWVARISAERWERDEAAMVTARTYRKILDSDLALGREFCFGGALLAPRPHAAEEPEQAAA